MRRAILAVMGLFFGACAEIEPPRGEVASPLLGGRDSTAAEDAAILISAANPKETRCSGLLVAPQLVLTARHCLLQNPTKAISCNGAEPREAQDLGLLPAQTLFVYLGSSLADTGTTDVDAGSAERKVPVRDIVTYFGGSICNLDAAYLVLAEPVEDIAPVPLRRTPVKKGDTLSFAGWGYSDVDETLPNQRQVRDDLVVEEPPEGLPAGMFVVGAGPCPGDSGGVALLGGAAVGVYSRFVGTSYENATNYFQGVPAIASLTEAAIDALEVPDGGTPAVLPRYVEDTPIVDGGVETDAEPAAQPTVRPIEGCSTSPHTSACSSLASGLLVGLLMLRRTRRANRARRT